MRRGEVWKAQIPAPVNERPVLVLSRNSMPAARPEITVAYLTTKPRGSRAEVPVTRDRDGVEKDSVVNLDSINTISKDWLYKYVCTLSSARMAEVKAAVLFALDLR